MASISPPTLGPRMRYAGPGALLLTLLTLFLVAPAPAWAEAPDTLVLTGTNPASPSIERRPRIQGDAGGVIILGVDPLAAAVGPVATATDNPGFAVTVYAEDPTCENEEAVVATGIAGDLEGVGIRIEDEVAEDSTTTFYATQSDPETEETSNCSNGIAYRQVATPPSAPAFTETNPASPADENYPRLLGAADPDATVSIYTSSSCSGGAVATGAGGAFAAGGIQVSVPDNSVTSFYAEAELAGYRSGCSTSSISYQEVTPPPAEEPGGGGPGEEGGEGAPSVEPPKPPAPNPPGRPPAPKLSTNPTGPANNNTPVITGKAPGAVTVKVFGSAGCKGPVLVKGSASELAAGLPVQVADDAVLSFYGVSVDGGGDQSVCSPEPAIYIEDSTAPRTRITGGPGLKTRKRTAIFRFTDVTGGFGTSFLCKVDRRRWRGCQAPLRLQKLGRRQHVVRVKAVDAAGNREEATAKRRFQVVR